MPTDACQYFYQCTNCKEVLKPKPGDCCVFCSYGTVKCRLNKNQLIHKERIEAIDNLLDGKQDIVGIALPGMSSGSPGMPARELEPFIIHSITLDGKDGGIFMEF